MPPHGGIAEFGRTERAETSGMQPCPWPSDPVRVCEVKPECEPLENSNNCKPRQFHLIMTFPSSHHVFRRDPAHLQAQRMKHRTVRDIRLGGNAQEVAQMIDKLGALKACVEVRIASNKDREESSAKSMRQSSRYRRFVAASFRQFGGTSRRGAQS